MPSPHEATVVVALIPGGDCIDATLAALARQDERHFELIIVDGRARGGRAESSRLLATAASSGLEARHLWRPGLSRAAANNLGIRLARTELVILLAHDFAPTPAFVAAHVALHRREPDRRVVGVGPGLFSPALRRSRFRRWLEDSGEVFGTSFTSPGVRFPERFFYCVNASAKRRFLMEAGLFDERFPFDAWDDAELGARLAHAGLRSVYVKDAVTWREHPVTFRDRRRAMRRAGASAAILESKDPGPHAWQGLARRSPLRLSLAAWGCRLRALTGGGSAAREEAWRLGLAATFAASYQRAQRSSARPRSS